MNTIANISKKPIITLLASWVLVIAGALIKIMLKGEGSVANPIMFTGIVGSGAALLWLLITIFKRK